MMAPFMLFIPFAPTAKHSSTYNDPTKKRGPPKGYIEAIEARLHRMEGLLGGLVKDKDPRAEIVKAELDAMAREAEMTGLKLRRSKAYEEITHVMNSYSKNISGSPAQNSTLLDIPLFEHSGTHNFINQNAPMHTRHQYSQLNHSLGEISTMQQPTTTTPTTTTTTTTNLYLQSTPSNRFSPSLNAAQMLDHSTSRQFHQLHARTSMQQQSLSQVPLDNHSPSLHINVGQIHTSYQQETSPQAYYTNHSSTGYSHQNNGRMGVSSPNLEADNTNHRFEESRRPSFQDHHMITNPSAGYSPNPQGGTEHDITALLPAPNSMDHLLNIHFRFVHPVLPMLHQKILYDQVHGNESILPHLLFAVFGLASRFSESPVFRTPQPGSDRPPCTVFYERAKQLIKEEYDHSQIGTVQALLLMSVQQMGFCESQKAWLHVGMAIRMAQDLGLNKELPEHEQSRNRLSAELRKRTWWSCYVVERLVCAGLGRPLSIGQEDCEISFPEFHADVDMVTESALSGQPAMISEFVHLIKLSRIQGDILQFTKTRAIHSDDGCDNHSSSPNIGGFGHRVDISQAAFFALDKSLTEWRQNLPSPIQNPTQSSHFGLFLHMTYNTLIILLHRPSFANSATSASLCNQAAATITDITEILMRANALTSMFVSCLYAIFSAGVIHFMNIPNAKCSSSASPTITPAYMKSYDHAMTARADLKRCIDALKHLSTHWVSAARRAKVLEDLLDLKHVSLKDLEEDTFKTAPLMPPWATETSQYGKILTAPREDHDRLRQKCRSKIMAIQSLLATDDEFQNIQSRDSFDLEEVSNEQYRVAAHNQSLGLHIMEPPPTEDSTMELSSDSQDESMTQINAKGCHSPPETTFTSAFPSAFPSNISLADRQLMEFPLDTDPMMLISTATFKAENTSDQCVQDTEMMSVRSPSIRMPKEAIPPMTLTTLGLKSDILSSENNEEKIAQTKGTTLSGIAVAPQLAGQQAPMLDPFSMPSSITFPSQGHGSRQASCGGIGPQSNTVWSTNALTHRAIARTEPSAVTSRKYLLNGTSNGEETSKISNFHRLTLSSDLGDDVSDEQESEDLSLSWNDMPPTLGLDEWMAYIGALMMRWLASGQSSPRSAVST
ncbi:hypothetical protein BGZ46_004737 [Entomortierella lignicola]|nr:hypothetical protein BGZ46_004737 [Entomortierella lignicola]